MKAQLKTLRYLIEAALLALIMLLFRLLPLDAASAFGGMIGQLIGPFLKAHRIAERNLREVFPDYSDYQRRTILSKMWNNLGRVAGEYPHLSAATMRRRLSIEGAEHLDLARGEKTGAVFVSGHFANWEMLPMIGVIYNLPITFIYREANNPYAERLIQWMRGPYRHMMVGKGRESAQQMIKALQKKQSVALLVDQKLNEGVLVPFLGYPARTALAATKMALKFKVPLMALHVVRTHGAHFHATVTSPIPLAPDADPLHAMQQIHETFETWIRQHPEQWFWVHNRWNWKEIHTSLAKE